MSKIKAYCKTIRNKKATTTKQCKKYHSGMAGSITTIVAGVWEEFDGKSFPFSPPASCNTLMSVSNLTDLCGILRN